MMTEQWIKSDSVIHVPFEPTLKQAHVLNNLLDEEVPLHGFVGGVGAGKTQLLCQVANDVTTTLPSNRIAVARKFRKDVEDTTFQEFLESLNPAFILDYSKSDFTIYIRTADPDHPAEIWFKGLDDVNRWGSTQFGHILIDEASEISANDITYLWGRLRKKLHANVLAKGNWKDSPYVAENAVDERGMPTEDFIRFILFISNSPPDDGHWINVLRQEGTLLNAQQRCYITEAHTYDNIQNLPAQFIKNLNNLPPLEYERLVEGRISPGARGPAATPAFSIEKNTFNDTWPTHPIFFIRGWDPQWSHPVAVWAQFIDGLILIWAEDYGTNSGMRDYIRESIRPREKRCHHLTDYRDWVDHQVINFHSPTSEKKKSVGDIMRDEGYHPVSKASNMEIRAELINDLCKAGRLKIHAKNCPRLITALRGGWYRDQVTKICVHDHTYEHLGDALGILLFGELGAKGRKIRTEYSQTPEAVAADPERPLELRLYAKRAVERQDDNPYHRLFGT